MDNFPQNRALINFLTQNNIEQKDSIVLTDKKEKTKSLRIARNHSESDLKAKATDEKEVRSINTRLDFGFNKSNKNDNEFAAVISNSYSEENIEEVCKYHSKKLEVICMEKSCQKKICYQCGLFGKHKNHKVKPEKEFLVFSEEFSFKMINVFEKLKKYMKFNLEKFCVKHIGKGIAVKEKEVVDGINRKYDVG